MIDIFKYFTINGAQVIYPKYALLVFLTSAIFLVVGVSFAKFLDNTFPKFEEQKEEDNEDSENVSQKHKVQLLVEVILQIGIIAVFSYILRVPTITNYYLGWGNENIIDIY